MIYTSPLKLHNDVKTDLADIKAQDKFAWAQLVALIQQLHADTKLAEKLLDHGYGNKNSAEISVNKWLSQWKQGKDLWRLKFRDMEDIGLKYRVIYLYLPQQARFVIMAVVKRTNFDYDNPNDSTYKRILSSLQRTYGLG